MAKQFNILATDVDLHVLEMILRETGNLDLYSDTATDDLTGLVPLDELSIPISKSGKTSLFCYFGPSLLPRRILIDRVSPVKTSINIQASHLIEFWRPFYNGEIMRPGRLYYQDRLVVNKTFMNKDVTFCDWAKGVMVVVRKALQRDSDYGVYVGEDAKKGIESGRIAVAPILSAHR